MSDSQIPDPTAPAAAAIRLPAELGIEAAGELYRELLAHVEDAAPVVLDGGEVTRVHGAALQLFCLFCRERRDGGRITHWQAPSVALRSAAELLGLADLMNLQTGSPQS